MSGISTGVSNTVTIEKLTRKQVPMTIKLYLISRNENLQALIGNMLYEKKQHGTYANIDSYKKKMMSLIYADLIRINNDTHYFESPAAGAAAAALAAMVAGLAGSVDIKKEFQNYYDSLSK